MALGDGGGGCIKQLLYCDKHTLLQKVLFAEDSNFSQVIVALGYESGKILEKIKSTMATFVINDNYKLGRSSSIKTGLLVADKNCMAVMFILDDVGGKLIATYHKNNVIEIIINSDAILFDIDTYEDCKKYHNRC